MAFSKKFLLLQREALLIRAMLYSGLESLGHASAQRKSLYYQSFFSLSVGIERLGKLIIFISKYPQKTNFRSYDHKLTKIVEDALKTNSTFKTHLTIETLSEIQLSILNCLNEFAMSERYFYLDSLSDSNRLNNQDPLIRWYRDVSSKVLQNHKNISKNIFNFKKFAIEPFTISCTMDESGNQMSLHEILENCSEKINRYAKLHIVQMLAPLSALLDKISHEKREMGLECPDFSEFFRDFNISRQMILNKKTWSV